MDDATRMTKPGGSVGTHFIEPGASPQGSIRTVVEKDFWYKSLPNMGVDNITITTMKHQGRRNQIVYRKTIEA